MNKNTFVEILEQINEKEKFINNYYLIYYFNGNVNKYLVLEKDIINNNFIREYTKKNFKKLFYKALKIYILILKFIGNIKIKRYNDPLINTDLMLNKLDEYKDKDIIIIYENKTKYKFYIYDLIKLWNISLLNQEELFSYPERLKNPYTNLNFSELNLHKIYNCALKNNIKIPIPIVLFYDVKFDIDKLVFTHYYYFLEKSITTHVNDMDIELYDEVYNIYINYKKYLKNIEIPLLEDEDDEEKLKIIEKTKELLISYYLSVYCSENTKIYHTKQFFLSLKKFNKNNVGFGRKIQKRNEETNKYETIFNLE
jgi:hypothetical protein